MSLVKPSQNVKKMVLPLLGLRFHTTARKQCKEGHSKKSLQILHTTDMAVDSSTYISLLQNCTRMKTLTEGKLIHAHLYQRGFTTDGDFGNALLNMYVKCGDVADARRVFDQMSGQDACTWTIMIAAYARRGPAQESLKLFHQMQGTDTRPNKFTFASVLPACAMLASLERGSAIHRMIISSGLQADVALDNALVDMYAKCGSLEKARQLFDEMPQRSVVSWTLMIRAFGRQGFAEEAWSLFRRMQRGSIEANEFTFATVLSVCAQLGALKQGAEIHGRVVRGGFHGDPFVMSSLVDMYSKCGRLDLARAIFEKTGLRNLVSWNAIVAGYAQNGMMDQALELFQAMPERDCFSWTAMIVGYAQNGLVEEALKLFQEAPQRDVFAWTAMIAGFAQNGHSDDALNFFRSMMFSGASPDSNTFVSVLPACASLAALEQGREIHQRVITTGFQSDTFVWNALIDMYAKCGSMPIARKLFNKMHWRDVASWNVMIGGYAMHGCCKEALELFEQMKNSGMSPDHITFVGVLSACSHAGMVDEGYQHFNNMTGCYHLKPAMEHYMCMVDILGRAGRLDEAQDFIKKMTIEPDFAVWTSLLAACRIHNNIELAECMAEHVFELKNAAPYVLLSNIYAAGGRWDDTKRLRKQMGDIGIRKTPGCSWIEVNKRVHGFLGGDR